MRVRAGVLLAFVLVVCCSASAVAQVRNDKYMEEESFRQLEEVLPTPNAQRTASGAPGPGYWQQRADYEIDARLDGESHTIDGAATITYTNNAPDTLTYLWVQLDMNIYAPDSLWRRAASAPSFDDWSGVSFDALRPAVSSFDGSAAIHAVVDIDGAPLGHRVVGTMMRIDLPEPLAPGGRFVFRIDWSHKVNDHAVLPGRSGYEYFEDEGAYLYEIAQWFPRMAAYTDVRGWQHAQFLGDSEFALEFGDYKVRLTVPDNHVLTATGVLQNPQEVLSPSQRSRLEDAAKEDEPVFIITPEEAAANARIAPSGEKTWVFHAKGVRDFAFASSPLFIWDAVLHKVQNGRGDGPKVWAMSLYPNQAQPLWSRYSTHAIMHTLDVYSRLLFDYPYPVAVSVNGPVYGMEYPMLCFNGPRPEADGTYSHRTKYGLISVVIHEVGHNWFPMIVNHDERQWTWMDEGLNTFMQTLAEAQWEEDYPSRRNSTQAIVEFMSSSMQTPIMTNGKSILQKGNNAYAKPAVALHVLRETVMGRELFDRAFREYATRWMFKRPEPADFFRTMEDASGVDLDWFWRGWFYTTDHVDVGIAGVRVYRISQGPAVEAEHDRAEAAATAPSLRAQRDKSLPKRVDRYPDLKDFYNTEYDGFAVDPYEIEWHQDALDELDARDREMIDSGAFFCVVDLLNYGGLVSPVTLGLTYESGATEEVRLPAEIWIQSNREFSKLIVTAEPVVAVHLDPHQELPDTDRTDNVYPQAAPKPSRFKLYQRSRAGGSNAMQEHRVLEGSKAMEAFGSWFSDDAADAPADLDSVEEAEDEADEPAF